MSYQEPATCGHRAVGRVFSEEEAPARYFQIIAFNHPQDIDNVCSSHIYPSYVSCMLKTGFYKPFSVNDMKDEPLMLQSNPADGLAFVKMEHMPEVVLRAKKTWPEKEFHIIEMDALFFGKRSPRWVVNA